MGEVANSVIGKVVDLLFGVAKREINYMSNCSENVQKLRNEAGKLRHMRGRVQQLVNVATEKGEDLLDGVQEWMDKADAQISMAEAFLEEEANCNAKMTCFNLQLCRLNLVTLHHYGKKATNTIPSLIEHQEDGKVFETRVSIPTRTPSLLELYQNKNLDGLDTQKLVLQDVIKAIEDESIQIIGIYGIGGVGKTTLAKEVVATAKNEFDDVVFISVSQTINATKLKKEVEAAAKRIMKGDKILIILDDVWDELKLDEVGIPCGIDHMNCKILLTSRSKDVCVLMNAQAEICVNSLQPEESWILFKRVVGKTVETDAKLKQVAKEVAKECGGLPLIVQAVGKALKNKSILTWETALEQLKKNAPSDIGPDIRKAFIHLKLSYDLLGSEDAKSCFLLCSMFPEDSRIPLERLTYYVVGLEMFNDLNSMDHARKRVRLAVNTLESSCLLLEERNSETTKMHDVVRDVALLIASKDNHKFLVEARKDLIEWKPRNKNLESYIGISLMNNNICKLPDYELHLPLLDIFLIQNNSNLSTFPNEFILSVKEARVLDIEDNNALSLPQSLKRLTRLRMLNLAGNRSLHEVSILGELKDLEILILNRIGITSIPQEFGQLVNLKHLEVKHCEDLSYITPGVMSRLCWLEELHIGFYSNEEGNYKSLEEIWQLSKLTFLYLFLPYDFYIPEDYHLGRLKGFIIQMGGREHISDFTWDQYSKGILVLETPLLYMEFLKQIKKLFKESQGIVLKTISNLKNVLPTLYIEGFDKLKNIEVFDCFKLLCLVDSKDCDQLQNFLPSKGLDGGQIKKKFLSELELLSLEKLYELTVLWSCPDDYISLNNLVTCNILYCPKLERLFSVSVACGLVNLQRLTIEGCECLEEVIWDRDEDTRKCEIGMVTNIVFPCLVEISLLQLRNLRSFNSRNSIIKYPSLVKVNVYDCHRMEKWGYGTHDTPRLEFVNDMNGISTIDDGLEKYRLLLRIRTHAQNIRAAYLFKMAGELL